MSEILFIIGMGLMIIGKVRIGGLDAEGPSVRAAGFMLMMPLIVIIFLSFMLGLMTGGNAVEMSRTIPFILFLQLPVIIVCVGVAYSLLKKETSNSENQDEPTDSVPEKPRTPAPSISKPSVSPQVPARRPAANFPTVMSTIEAARYLNVTEQAIMKLIDEGKITAARINYRYRISRSVLDEFLQDQTPSAE